MKLPWIALKIKIIVLLFWLAPIPPPLREVSERSAKTVGVINIYQREFMWRSGQALTRTNKVFGKSNDYSEGVPSEQPSPLRGNPLKSGGYKFQSTIYPHLTFWTVRLNYFSSRGGEIGRHARFRTLWAQACASSSLARGTHFIAFKSLIILSFSPLFIYLSANFIKWLFMLLSADVCQQLIPD